MKYSEVFILTEGLAQQCIDDRTADFTLALMDFANWDKERGTRSSRFDEIDQDFEEVKVEKKQFPVAPTRQRENSFSSSGDQDQDQNQDPGSNYYEWPDFLLNMMRQPSVWASWRKKVERSILSNIRPGEILCVCLRE